MARTTSDPENTPASSGADAPNPVWFKPVMFGFMLVGLVWILVYYVSQSSSHSEHWAVEHHGGLRHYVHRLPHDDTLALIGPSSKASPEGGTKLHLCDYPQCGIGCG